MVEDTHEYNKDTSRSPTEAAVRTATDPFGLQMFFKTMGAKFKGKPRFCIPENMFYLGSPADECKLFRVRNSADIFTDPTIHFMLRVEVKRHNPQTGGEETYPTSSTGFQNEIKHNEDYEFIIPAARPAVEVNGVQIPAVPAGYVVVSISDDTFTDTFGGIAENKAANCAKSVIITYDEIIPGKEYGVRAPNGCIEFGDRSAEQKETDKFFSGAYEEFAESKQCAEDAFYSGLLPWLEDAGEDGINELFGKDGLFMNPEQWGENTFNDLKNMELDKVFDGEGLAGLDMNVSFNDFEKNPMFDFTNVNSGDFQDMSDDIERWTKDEEKWEEGLETASRYANVSGLAYEKVGEEVKTLIENPKDSKIVDFFGDIGDSIEDTFTGENGGMLDLFNPGNWKSPF
jgi:hypothetical protein